MEQKSTSLWKSAITYGIYIGIASILVSVIYYATGNTFAKSSQWVAIAVMIIAIILGGILMIWLSERVSKFLQKNRMYEVLGLFILFLVGFYCFYNFRQVHSQVLEVFDLRHPVACPPPA